MTMFSHLPAKPKSTQCLNSFTILCNAHDASTSFLDTFDKSRKARKAKGTPTDEEQDLLRAMLVFATAGLDSMAKQLIREALPVVIANSTGAEAMFKQFIERSLRGPEDIGRRLLADVLGDARPRERLMEALISDLTAGSLQSADELLRVAAYFDIPSKELVAAPDDVKKIFQVRNQIVHEMDVNFAAVNRNRRSRAKGTMVKYTNEIFRVAADLLAAVDGKCKP